MHILKVKNLLFVVSFIGSATNLSATDANVLITDLFHKSQQSGSSAHTEETLIETLPMPSQSTPRDLLDGCLKADIQSTNTDQLETLLKQVESIRQSEKQIQDAPEQSNRSFSYFSYLNPLNLNPFGWLYRPAPAKPIDSPLLPSKVEELPNGTACSPTSDSPLDKVNTRKPVEDREDTNFDGADKGEQPAPTSSPVGVDTVKDKITIYAHRHGLNPDELWRSILETTSIPHNPYHNEGQEFSGGSRDEIRDLDTQINSTEEAFYSPIQLTQDTNQSNLTEVLSQGEKDNSLSKNDRSSE